MLAAFVTIYIYTYKIYITIFFKTIFNKHSIYYGSLSMKRIE